MYVMALMLYEPNDFASSVMLSWQPVAFYRAALYATRSFLWASVRPSVCQTRELWQTKALAKKVQLWLIGSRPRAFQSA